MQKFTDSFYIKNDHNHFCPTQRFLYTCNLLRNFSKKLSKVSAIYIAHEFYRSQHHRHRHKKAATVFSAAAFKKSHLDRLIILKHNLGANVFTDLLRC